MKKMLLITLTTLLALAPCNNAHASKPTLKDFYNTIPLETEVEFFDKNYNLILDKYGVQNIDEIVNKYGSTTDYAVSTENGRIYIDLLDISCTPKYTAYGTAYNAECVHCGNQFVEIIDDNGNVWHMTGVKVADGQRVKLRMDTMGTPSIYDDEIIKIKKIKQKV